MTNLYDLTVEAANAIDTYRHPNLDDWVAAIDPVLQAAGKGRIGDVHVDEIKIGQSNVIIHTSYSVRMCAQSDETHIPLFILKAKDPIYEAKQYRLVKAIAEAADAYRRATDEAARFVEQIEMLNKELKALHSSEFAK